MTLDMNTIRARLEAEQAELQKVCIDQLLLSLEKTRSGFAEKERSDSEENSNVTMQIQQVQAPQSYQLALLADINEAIKRIDQGIYGRCAVCNKPLPERRLTVLPWTIRDVQCEVGSDPEYLSDDEILIGRD